MITTSHIIDRNIFKHCQIIFVQNFCSEFLKQVAIYAYVRNCVNILDIDKKKHQVEYGVPGGGGTNK